MQEKLHNFSHWPPHFCDIIPIQLHCLLAHLDGLSILPTLFFSKTNVRTGPVKAFALVRKVVFPTCAGPSRPTLTCF